MWRKIFLGFLLLLMFAFFAVFGYWIWMEKMDKKPVVLEESSLATEQEEEVSLDAPIVVEQEKTVPTPLNYESVFNQELMEKLLADINYEIFQGALKLNKETLSENTAENGYEINNFQINPEVFQRLFLQTIAAKLNFLNLRLEFSYYDDYQAVHTKIIDQNEPANTVDKYFRIQTREPET